MIGSILCVKVIQYSNSNYVVISEGLRWKNILFGYKNISLLCAAGFSLFKRLYRHAFQRKLTSFFGKIDAKMTPL